VKIEKKRGDNESSNSRIRARKEARMEKKLLMLQKRYPNNKYEMDEVTSKGVKGEYKVTAIIRTEGRRPHKVKVAKTGVK